MWGMIERCKTSPMLDMLERAAPLSRAPGSQCTSGMGAHFCRSGC